MFLISIVICFLLFFYYRDIFFLLLFLACRFCNASLINCYNLFIVFSPCTWNYCTWIEGLCTSYPARPHLWEPTGNVIAVGLYNWSRLRYIQTFFQLFGSGRCIIICYRNTCSRETKLFQWTAIKLIRRQQILPTY